MPTFLKYHDKTNPIFMSFAKFKKYFNNPMLTMYWINSNEKNAGQIWIYVKNEKAEIARLFVLKQYQNQGVAQNAIKLAQREYQSYKEWHLDTIKEEKNNCHLYEKMGYVQIGNEKPINNKMTIVNYIKVLK